jgi:hypothetical protein
MGIDFLDISFRVERELGVRFDTRDLPPEVTTRRPRDLTVEELLKLVVQAREKKPAAGSTEFVRSAISCISCGRSLKGVPIPGFCRHCGTSLGEALYVWMTLRKILVDALVVPQAKVLPEAFLVKDLGCT